MDRPNPYDPRNALLAALSIAAALGALVVCVFGAPAPAPRERLPHPAPCAGDLVGDWRMSWGGCDYRCALHAGGAYRASPGDWHGDWTLTDGVLRVRESAGGGGLDWSALLKRVRGGYDGDAYELRLRRPERLPAPRED